MTDTNTEQYACDLMEEMPRSLSWKCIYMIGLTNRALFVNESKFRVQFQVSIYEPPRLIGCGLSFGGGQANVEVKPGENLKEEMCILKAGGFKSILVGGSKKFSVRYRYVDLHNDLENKWMNSTPYNKIVFMQPSNDVISALRGGKDEFEKRHNELKDRLIALQDIVNNINIQYNDPNRKGYKKQANVQTELNISRGKELSGNSSSWSNVYKNDYDYNGNLVKEHDVLENCISTPDSTEYQNELDEQLNDSVGSIREVQNMRVTPLVNPVSEVVTNQSQNNKCASVFKNMCISSDTPKKQCPKCKDWYCLWHYKPNSSPIGGGHVCSGQT